MNTFIHEDIVVAIGMETNPYLGKKYKLISIFKITEKTEKQNGIFVLCLANKNAEKILISEKAGSPKEKQNKALAEFLTLSKLNDP